MSASAYSSQGTYQAMTATIFDEPQAEAQDDSERVITIATKTFEALPI
jgi:hypothetical protein